jgi:arabinan endo-1,5-alpha-L-arabinosidase
MLRAIVVAALLLVPLAAHADEPARAPALVGDTRIHDPSVIELGGHWASFQTGEEGGLYQGAVLVKTSPDGITWTKAGAIGKGVPKWTQKALGYKSRNIWAPSVFRRGDTTYLYYSVSSFGLSISTIGLMTNAAFDPVHPGDGWTDQGEVVTSHGRDDFNAIDPYRIDLADGRAFLSYGSYWSGIKLSELDPTTGKLLRPDTPRIALADRNGAGIEASSILAHAGRFYLFVSFDQCCKAMDSTYRIMVGRADTIAGPYVARDGTPMLRGGATKVQARLDRYIGPGGAEPVVSDSGRVALAYHYYDGDDYGAPKLQIAPINWDDGGWPMLAPPP